MATNYDAIAEQYRRSKQQPWRTHIEAFTLMELIGDPAGEAVVDVACGEAFTPGFSGNEERERSLASTSLSA